MKVKCDCKYVSTKHAHLACMCARTKIRTIVRTYVP